MIKLTDDEIRNWYAKTHRGWYISEKKLKLIKNFIKDYNDEKIIFKLT